MIRILLLLITLPFGLYAQNSIEKADALYLQKSYSESANAYEKILSDNPENYRAWQRLAQSYIEIKNGEKAVDALIKVAEGQKLPPPLLHYMQAQAYLLRKDKDTMWQELNLSAAKGYSNTKSLDLNIWDEIREDQNFISFTSEVNKNAKPCEYNPKHREFDFWLGQWEVHTDIEKKTPLAGTNTIAKEQNGCMLSENWTSINGNPGYSLNYYDGTKGKWVQHWVSAGGVVINMEGGLVDGSMILSGPIYYEKVQGPKIRTLKGTWTPLENGVVRQFFEESIDQGKTWYPWFEGFYFPKQ